MEFGSRVIQAAKVSKPANIWDGPVGEYFERHYSEIFLTRHL